MMQAKRLLPALASVALLTGLAGCGTGGAQEATTGAAEESSTESAPAEDAQQVFMLLPNTTTTRFEERDAPLFIESLSGYAPNAEVTVLNAEGDPEKQQGQVEDALTQGADVIVLTAADSNLVAGSLAAAEAAGVPVVLYDHDAKGGLAEAHVVFDSLAVGQAQGSRAADVINGLDGNGIKVARIMGNPGEFGTTQYKKGQDEFLQPLVDSGKIEIVCEQNIANWDPVAGQAYIEDCLAQNGNDLDVIISMNDGLAGGSIAALTTQGLEGDVIVTGGQDANLSAIQFVVKGYQDNTIWKDLIVQADYAAQVVASLLAGNGVPADLVNGEVDNEFMKVPAVFLPVTNLTIDNVSDIIDSGLYTWEQACEGAEDAPICVENLG